MSDRTNPRRARRRGAAERSADDRPNPKAPAKSGAAERRAGHDRTDPSAAANPAAAGRSAAEARTNPNASAKRGAGDRPADGRTNPKTSTKPGAAKRRERHDRTDPSAGANPAAAGRSAAEARTNPSAAANSPAAERSADNRVNPSRSAKPGTAERTADDRTNPSAAPPARLHYDDAYIRRILQRVKTIAAVGMSANDMRPSYFAMLYLQQKGYRMIPVNPRYAGREILGETVVASLGDLPAAPDMVQIFRRSEEAPAVVDEAIRAGAKVVWLQLGIRSDEAAERARAAGLDVVMDRCPKIEYGRLFGEIGWAGVNRRVISAKKGQAVQLSHRKGGLARRPAPRR
jgi:predicted CoA-binding protein